MRKMVLEELLREWSRMEMVGVVWDWFSRVMVKKVRLLVVRELR